MVRGSAYSAIMQLTVVGLVLFAASSTSPAQTTAESATGGDVQIAQSGDSDDFQTPNDAVTALMAELASKVPRLKNLRDQLEHPHPEELTPSMVRSANRMKKLSNEGYGHA